MTFDLDSFQKQIPHYLTADPKQKILLSELNALNEGANKGYITPRNADANFDSMLQGDAWRAFQLFSFKTGKLNSIRGIVLSNSCDVAAENERTLPPNITFAPIVRLSRLKSRFEERGLSNEQISQKLLAIRSQATTNIFYLPAEAPLEEEHVALLDDVHSMPVELHGKTGEKIFTLSMAGFYLLLFKLSVHFCRMHEGIDRSSKVA